MRLELPTYEERRNYKELSVLSNKIDKARFVIDDAVSPKYEILKNQLIIRLQRQRNHRNRIIEKENERLWKSLCEIKRRPSRNLLDMGLRKSNNCLLRNKCSNNDKKLPHSDLSNSSSALPSKDPLKYACQQYCKKYGFKETNRHRSASSLPFTNGSTRKCCQLQSAKIHPVPSFPSCQTQTHDASRLNNLTEMR